MGQEEAYEKISTTAKLIAHIRAATDIPFAKEIAAASGAETDFQTLAGKSAEFMTQSAFNWEARYKTTDQIIARYHITQVLEIAAGLSPRGLAMTENPDVVYVATDLPEILEQEKAIAESILAKSNTHRPHLYYRIANALDRESLLQAASPFRSDKPVAIITEGLLPYLAREEKEALASNIHYFLEQHDGIWITPDVSTKQTLKFFSQADDTMLQRMQNIYGATGRDIETNVFEDEKAVRQFFTDAGFTIEEYPWSNVLEDLSSVKLSKFKREEILEILQMLKTLILRIGSS
ncbi:MAG TPA: class I SAM-dependent methyltransferase [Candidatus Bathyarchaeia archaeon]|nr:class I SAM-dependent methyltransferase [Candidatus Bathyarchaeia archaeon]